MSKRTRRKITPGQFEQLTRPIIGLPVSRAWRGYGSAIFLEVGQLHEKVRTREDGSQRISYRGDFTLMIQWSWRVERARSVAFGSWSTKRVIDNRLAKLQEAQVIEVTAEGRLPEIQLQLSSGLWLRSFMTTQGQPQWCLLSRSSAPRWWVTSENGALWHTVGGLD